MRNVSLLGLKVPEVAVSGPGGRTGFPLRVRKAKLAGSTQLLFARAPGGLAGPWRAPNWACRLKIAIAAHQWVMSQEIFLMNGAYPGGYS